MQAEKEYTWSELQQEFPEEWCALIDVVLGDDRRVPFQTAHLIFHGGRDEASDSLIDSRNGSKMLICTNTEPVLSMGGVLV